MKLCRPIKSSPAPDVLSKHAIPVTQRLEHGLQLPQFVAAPAVVTFLVVGQLRGSLGMASLGK